MELFSPQFFILTLALVGVAIIVAALLSGLIDRSDVPQVAFSWHSARSSDLRDWDCWTFLWIR